MFSGGTVLTIITCAGYGSSGSSAITDYISEFSCVKSLGASVEFQLISEPGGIYDLEHALSSGNSLLADMGISRFINLYHDFTKRFPDLFTNADRLLKEYFADLGVVEWRGGWYGSFRPPKSRNEKTLEIMSEVYFKKLIKNKTYDAYEPESCPWLPSFYPYANQYYAFVPHEKFSLATKKFLGIFFTILANTSEFLMVDHLFPPATNSSYNSYVDNVKTICVDKNPIDLYLLNYIVRGERWIPSNDVDTFIKWYRASRLHRKTEQIADANNFLLINFEDMVYRYESTSQKINSFVGLKETAHDRKFNFFTPDKSRQNTYVESRFVLTDKLKKDVDKIKTELDEYCYDFDSFYTENDVANSDKKEIIMPIYEIRKVSDAILIDKTPLFSLFFDTVKKDISNRIKIYFGPCIDLYKKRKKITVKNIIGGGAIIVTFPFFFMFQAAKSLVKISLVFIK